jgi:hypothetical protein
MMDIFEFWSQIKRGETVHPADRKIFTRINPEKHGFQLDCLPASYGGKLKTAPVVFLFSSPGYSEFDLEDAQSEEGKEYYLRRWTGEEPFRDHGRGKAWLLSRTKIYAPYEIARHYVATIYPAHRKFPSEDMPRQLQLSNSLSRRLYRIAHLRRQKVIFASELLIPLGEPVDCQPVHAAAAVRHSHGLYSEEAIA